MRVPQQTYFAGSAVFHYLGPSFAVLLFARVQVLGVAWLRIASAALIFAAWRRPWRAFRTLDRDGRWLLVAWGLVLAVMNACFYSAISRLPLGTVAAIEFLPVIVHPLRHRSAGHGAPPPRHLRSDGRPPARHRHRHRHRRPDSDPQPERNRRRRARHRRRRASSPARRSLVTSHPAASSRMRCC